jgi:hypothetical protein
VAQDGALRGSIEAAPLLAFAGEGMDQPPRRDGKSRLVTTAARPSLGKADGAAPALVHV